MLIFSYKKLFSIKVRHAYYASLASGDLNIIVTGADLSKMKGYGMGMKQNKDGLTIFGGVEENGKLSKSLSGLDKLTFYLYLKNPNFLNFSDLPLDKEASEVFYFNNKVVNKKDVFSTGTQELMLNKGDFVSDLELMRLEKEVFKYTHSDTGSEKTAQLFYTDTGVVVSEMTVEKVDNHFHFEFLLHNMKAGRYHLRIDGIQKDSFYYPGSAKTAQLFGIVEIFASVPNDNKFVNALHEISYKDFTLAFNNRKTIWNYNIINKNGASPVDPIVRQSAHPWNFNRLSPDLYQSVGPMPLHEQPISGIEYLTDQSDNGSVMIHHLPNPGVNLIKPDANDINKIYSDIYVYI